MTDGNQGLIRLALAVLGTAIIVGGIVLSAGGLKKQIILNAEEIEKNTSEAKLLNHRVNTCEKILERKDVEYKNLCEKMDAILIQMTALSAMQQSTAIEVKTTNISVDMMKENFEAFRTQVREALKVTSPQ